MTDEQKIMMAYGVMRITLDEIASLKPQDYRGDGDTLSDAIRLARKARAAVDELVGKDVK